MNNGELIEYYGISPGVYEYFESFEEVFSFEDVKILEIIRVYGNTSVVYKKVFEGEITSCILKFSLSMEYVDLMEGETISVLFKEFYVPFNFKGKYLELLPKIKELHVKLLSPSIIYLYASVFPED